MEEETNDMNVNVSEARARVELLTSRRDWNHRVATVTGAGDLDRQNAAEMVKLLDQEVAAAEAILEEVVTNRHTVAMAAIAVLTVGILVGVVIGVIRNLAG